MKKAFYYLLFLLIITSCSKKVEFQGKIEGMSPLDRVEFIEASGVATLPLVNVGIAPNGTFKGEFKAPKNGIYLMTYGGSQKLIYVKKGQKLNIQGNVFSDEISFHGDGKNNNTFLIKIQEELSKYVEGIDFDQKFSLPQSAFIKEVKSFHQDLKKKTEDVAKEHKADSEVINWKLDDLRVGVLDILFKYKELNKVKPNKDFLAFEKELKDNEDQLIEEFPAYRSYLLNELTDEFDAYFQKNGKGKIDVFASEVFVEFLKTKPNLSNVAKDYLTAFVMAQMDITQQTEFDKIQKIRNLIDKEIHTKSVKEDLNKVVNALGGLKMGENAPNGSLLSADDKSIKISDFKGKPTVLIFYSSWTQNLIEEIEAFTKLVDFYNKEVNFVAINFDDTKVQFKKTSSIALKNIGVINAYADKGLASEVAEKYFIYGFKLKPTYMVLDKDSKVASPFYFYVDDKRFTDTLDKLSGLKFSGSEAVLQNELFNTETDE